MQGSVVVCLWWASSFGGGCGVVVDWWWCRAALWALTPANNRAQAQRLKSKHHVCTVAPPLAAPPHAEKLKRFSAVFSLFPFSSSRAPYYRQCSTSRKTGGRGFLSCPPPSLHSRTRGCRCDCWRAEGRGKFFSLWAPLRAGRVSLLLGRRQRSRTFFFWGSFHPQLMMVLFVCLV